MAQRDRFTNRYGVAHRTLAVMIPEAHYDKLQDLAKSEQETLTSVVRRLIRQRIEHL